MASHYQKTLDAAKVNTNCLGQHLQDQEIAALKAKYANSCKVISDIGDFSHVITIQKENQPLTIKFQLEASYPESVPYVVVRNSRLDVSDKTELTSKVNSMAQSRVGSKMIDELAEFAFSWCEGKECIEVADAKSSKHTSKLKNKKHNKLNVQDIELKSEKKLPSMKTAEDVISRIMWDENIPTDCFCVGYEDRFIGIVERQFIEFSWEDIASVDYDTLAIPKHRIQYFKYKGLVVWDKSKRLDNVFGSTGSGMKITDVIEKYEAENEPVSQITSDSDSEEDDEDIVITVDSGNIDDGLQYARDKYWGPKKRPTHFVCLRVIDPAIVEAMAQIHKQILDSEPSYEESLIPPRKLHMTLACLGLDDDYEVEQAADFLKDIQPDLESFKPKETIQVEFHGVDHFFHNVLYAKVKDNENMMNFVQHLRDCIKRAGIDIRDVFDFTPHMTILKFKKHHQAMAHTRYIDSKFYDMFANVYFGKQSFDNIYLCKMTAEDEGDFYVCPRKIDL